MGLAPYGEPRYTDLILEHLLDLKADGSFRLDMGYFNYATGLTMTNRKFDALFGAPEGRDHMQGSYVGPRFSDEAVRGYLDSVGANYRRLEDGEIEAELAKLLADENVLGWFRGRMEFGPRALEGRSILGDPLSPKMQSLMNLYLHPLHPVLSPVQIVRGQQR